MIVDNNLRINNINIIKLITDNYAKCLLMIFLASIFFIFSSIAQSQSKEEASTAYLIEEMSKQNIDITFVKELIKNGAKPTQALKLLLEQKAINTSVAQMLIEAGADVDTATPGQSGKTFLHCAAEWNDRALIDFLIKHGANVNTTDENEGYTALHYACRKGSLDIVSMLLAAGADPNRVDSRKSDGHGGGVRPIHCACMNGNAEIVELLIKHGANLEEECSSAKIGFLGGNHTPLNIAVMKGNSKIVELLLKAGAKSYRNKNGNAGPLFWAEYYKHNDIADMLKKYGAK